MNNASTACEQALIIALSNTDNEVISELDFQ